MSSVDEEMFLHQAKYICNHYWKLGENTSTQCRVLFDIGGKNQKVARALGYKIMENIQLKDPNKMEMFGRPLKNSKLIDKLMKEAETKGELVGVREAKEYFIPRYRHATELIVAPRRKASGRSFRDGVIHNDIDPASNFGKCFCCYTCLFLLDDVGTEAGSIDFWEGPKRSEHNPRHPYNTVSGMEKTRMMGAAGTLIIFDSCVFHQSIRNFTTNDTRRLSWFVFVTK
jgi:hypothetical protein